MPKVTKSETVVEFEWNEVFKALLHHLDAPNGKYAWSNIRASEDKLVLTYHRVNEGSTNAQETATQHD